VKFLLPLLPFLELNPKLTRNTAAIYATILTNKLASITPEKVSAAALAAGLPQSSLASLLASQSNTTAVVGITPRITAAVALATAQAAAKSFQ
jgi:hypothetical protein